MKELTTQRDKEAGTVVYRIDGVEVTSEEYHTALMEYYNSRRIEGPVFEEDTRDYKYSDFESYFRAAASNLWNVTEWDNHTIKAWLEDAFHCGRLGK